MRNNRLLTLLIVMLMSFTLMIAMTACGSEDENAGSDAEESTAAELSDAEMDSLMKQVAESDLDGSYADFLTDERFANAEVFGIDREGDQGTMYAYINDGEYVVFKDKAYEVSGGAGDVIIKFEYTDDGVKLSELIWSADGGDHDIWMEENFPAEYLEKENNYEGYDADGNSYLSFELNKQAEEALGVPVETDDLLEIDLENGTYELVRIIESGEGDDYQFDFETIDKGSLK